MAVRCLPERPRFAAAAEELVWRALRKRLPAGSVLVANQRFTDRSGDCEADLIAAVPGVGVAVLEVKGGQLVHTGQGWMQSNARFDRRVDPVEQGRRSKYALRSFLDRSQAWPGPCDVRLAHLVVFPHTAVARDISLPDCPRWMIIDKDEVEHVSERLIAVLDGLETGQRRPTHADVDALVAALTGRLATQRDLASAAPASRGDEPFGPGTVLIEDQGAALDRLSEMHRAEVRGGPGSGKTWLAVEKARRLGREGQRVGLLCCSAGLAAYLRRRAELLDAGERPAYVGDVAGLGTRWGLSPPAGDGTADGSEGQPAAMLEAARRLSTADRFDAFVVDEAQELPEPWWPALLAALREPDSGRLYVFADEGQRVLARYGRPPVQLMPVPMDVNLRSSPRSGAPSTASPGNPCAIGATTGFPYGSSRARRRTPFPPGTRRSTRCWRRAGHPSFSRSSRPGERIPATTSVGRLVASTATGRPTGTTKTSSTATCSGSRGWSGPPSWWR